jgi:hypothetical protein
MRRVLHPLWVLLALIFLAEAWLWDRLEPVVARVVSLLPLPAFKAWLAARVARLSPAATLIVFAVPALPLFPLKIIGVWLLTHEYFISAALVIIFAKLLGVGIMAFVFDVTRSKLLQMGWFAWLYRTILAIREWAGQQIAPVKLALSRLRERLGTGASSRLIQRLRRRAQSTR